MSVDDPGPAVPPAHLLEEARELRRFGLKNPIAVVPNGISAEWLWSAGEAQRFRDTFEIAPGARILLFLSRITPKKGLPLLLESIKAGFDAVMNPEQVAVGRSTRTRSRRNPKRSS